MARAHAYSMMVGAYIQPDLSLAGEGVLGSDRWWRCGTKTAATLVRGGPFQLRHPQRLSVLDSQYSTM